MAGHKAQLCCPLSLSGVIITVTLLPPNLAASHASEPRAVFALGSLLFQGPESSGPGCERVSWTLHGTRSQLLPFASSQPLKVSVKKCSPGIFTTCIIYLFYIGKELF